jgi:hypothetical protein
MDWIVVRLISEDAAEKPTVYSDPIIQEPQKISKRLYNISFLPGNIAVFISKDSA